jgi:PAS domain S-box-containing protein
MPPRRSDPSSTFARPADGYATDLLLEAGAVLASSLDLSVTMHQVAGLTVPRLADLCVIDLRDDDGAIRDVAVAAIDTEIELGLSALREHSPVVPGGEHPVSRVIASGEPELIADMPDELLRAIARSEAHAEFMIASHYRSAIVAPLPARGRTLGAISELRLGEGEPFGPEDLGLVCELARRAALAIDNARLFSDLQQLERRTEAILVSLAEAVSVIDARGRTVFANQAAADLLGAASPQELLDAVPGSIMRRFLVYDEQGNELELAQMPARRLFAGETPEPLLVRNVIRATGEERWLMVRASPILDPDSDDVSFAVNVFENITEVKRAERAEALLAEASRALATSLDLKQTLEQVARLAVPEIADWCAVDIVEESGRIELVTVHHREPAKLELLRQLQAARRPRLDDSSGIGEVIATGRAHLFAETTPEALAAFAHAPEQLGLLAQIGAQAAIVVPMTVGGRALGAITLVCSEHRGGLSQRDLLLAEELGRRAATAVENARIYTERTRIAHTLQQALLPSSLPTGAGVEVHALYEAAGELNEVGGDFYDVLEQDDGRLLLMIGDVCGKGPRAAATTALARHTLRAAAISGQGPAAMLTTLHRAILYERSSESLCTAAVVAVERDGEQARLVIALGGHQPPLLIDRRGEAVAVGRPGTLLGAVDPIYVHETEARLHPGDTLLLYTDGVTDAGRSGNRLGEGGLAQLCADAPSQSLQELLARIKAAALHRVGTRPRDDIMLLAMRLD